MADGSKAVAMGELINVPVQFGNCTIPIDMIITEGTTYDIILGNNWLNLAQAKIDLGAAKMRICAHNIYHEIQLDLYRGARPPMKTTSSEESDAEQVYHTIL